MKWKVHFREVISGFPRHHQSFQNQIALFLAITFSINLLQRINKIFHLIFLLISHNHGRYRSVAETDCWLHSFSIPRGQFVFTYGDFYIWSNFLLVPMESLFVILVYHDSFLQEKISNKILRLFLNYQEKKLFELNSYQIFLF